jgi:hypothetical protein
MLHSAAGLHGMMALRAGARHATLAQRWLYLSLAAHEMCRDAGFDSEQVVQLCSGSLFSGTVGCILHIGVCSFKVVSKEPIHTMSRRRSQVTVLYKRPTDLALREDVPVVCNLLLADIMDEGNPPHTNSRGCQ